MTQKFAAALVAALLLCAGARIAAAQDNTNTAPAAAAPEKSDKMDKKGHKEHGMDACKDDVAKFCADAKTHKEKHECLEKHEAELSPACKKHHEKMEKKWKKGHKGEKGEMGEKGEKAGDMDKGADQPTK